MRNVQKTKLEDLKSRGYKTTGEVLINDAGDVCICDQGAVRWLTRDEHWGLMQATLLILGKYKTALADAIRRPMGVVPDSAEGLLTHAEYDAAEQRRAPGVQYVMGAGKS